MADEHKPQQGDEADLFRSYNDVLMRRVRSAVRTSPETVEDACAIAWAQFIRYQPDRNRAWRAWLFTTAERAAWVLDAQRREMDSINAEPGDLASAPEPADRHDQFAERDDLEAAIDVLEQLPPRLRRIAFLKATGHRYEDIGEITGDSRTRVSQLVRRANDHIQAALEELDVAVKEPPPRAKRLRELEEAPPQWLVREIGRPPRGFKRQNAFATRLLSWRRAALAIEDFRQLTGFDSQVRALGLRPREERHAEAFDTAVRAIEVFGRQRARCHDLDR
jgi:RNA polymerase sigma factor (sigma-70 family)